MIGRRFFLRKQAQRSFTLIVQYPGTTPVQCTKLKNPDGSNVISEDGRRKRSQNLNLDVMFSRISERW